MKMAGQHDILFNVGFYRKVDTTTAKIADTQADLTKNAPHKLPLSAELPLPPCFIPYSIHC